jgi:hypothetical protein
MGSEVTVGHVGDAMRCDGDDAKGVRPTVLHG